MKRKNKKEKEKKSNGVPTGAIVVLISVIVILAGTLYILTIGKNGFVTKAQQASETSRSDANPENETEQEKVKHELSSEMIAAKDKEMLKKAENTVLKTSNNESIIIPAGFKIAEDSGAIPADGIVIEDKDANQFVWVPVKDINSYLRIDFGKQTSEYNQYMESVQSDEKNSITKYHGFFIGRYETGDTKATQDKKYRNQDSKYSEEISIKKNQIPYNFVDYNDSKKLAEGMKTTQEYIKTCTKLCSSFAWDSTIRFMQNKISNYGTSSPQGNYAGSYENYIDIDGTEKIADKTLIPTGETTPICKIYDMGGNLCEWTTENFILSLDDAKTWRGASYLEYYNNSAGYRGIASVNTRSENIGFRISMFLN